jgi:hypothetical protein
MSNPISDLRAALVEHLAGSFPEAIVASGMSDEPTRDKDRIYVFWANSPTAPNVNYARPQMRIRYFKALPKIGAQLKNVPRDDGPLEQAYWDLASALMPVRASLLPGILYFELANVSPVRDEFAVEAILLVHVQNPGALPV